MSTNNSIITRSGLPKLRDLRGYYKNAKIGDVESIAESLKENGQYRRIVVNVGTHTGRKNEVLAGNHTMLGARKLGWETIAADFVDVDEERAAKINLVDNKSADNGSYDEELLAEILSSMTEFTGTGFSDDEVDKLLKSAPTNESVEELTKSAFTGLEEEDDRSRPEVGDSGDSEGFDESPGDAGSEPRIEKASEELRGGFDLKDELEDVATHRVGYWGIPKLRTDMLMTFDELPDNLESWAGSATKDWPEPDQWWLYNWGIDSTSGMKDISKVIISFYAYDEYFENWFWDPKKYVIKMLNSGIKYMVTPNYSQWPDQSRFLNLWAVYRSRYVGRYAQEAGVKIIPDINWPMGDLKFLEKHVLGTLPTNLPLIALQLQTFDKKEVEKQQETQREAFQLVIDTLSPEGVLLYAGKPGREWFEKNVKFDGRVMNVENRIVKLAEQQKNRTKKTTI